MVINLADLDGIVARTVLDRFDGGDLSGDPQLGKRPVTGHRFAQGIWDELRGRLTTVTLDRIVVRETEDTCYERADVLALLQ